MKISSKYTLEWLQGERDHNFSIEGRAFLKQLLYNLWLMLGTIQAEKRKPPIKAHWVQCLK